MSLWGRIKEWVSDHLPGGSEPTPSDTSQSTPSRESSDRDVFEPGARSDVTHTPSDSELPPGWIIAGLYHQGEKPTHIHATDVTHVTDSDIRRADAIIVQYLPAGSDGYRWIHGARNWRSVADQIERTVKVVSPTAE